MRDGGLRGRGAMVGRNDDRGLMGMGGLVNVWPTASPHPTKSCPCLNISPTVAWASGPVRRLIKRASRRTGPEAHATASKYTPRSMRDGCPVEAHQRSCGAF